MPLDKLLQVCYNSGAMFVRAKNINQNGRTYQYLHIVENYRDGGKVRQRIIGSLGRLDELQESGNLERVITQLTEHCPSVRLIKAQAAGNLELESDNLWGPALLFGRLWEELGLKELLSGQAKWQRFNFDFERMAFALTLQRLIEPGSDLNGSKWIKTVYGAGFEGLNLQHFYRGAGFLWKKKEEIEEWLYKRGQDLFNQETDLVFFDTTTTYFEGKCWEGWAKLGNSKDHKPDHLQLVLGVVMRQDGVPISCEIWPGNTSDMKTLQPVISRLRERFRLRRIIFVCDRGMVSRKNLNAIRDAGYEYIVGMKMRRLLEVRDTVLRRAGRYQQVADNLEVKEVLVGKRRYVICLNPEEAKKDQQDREAILEKLRKRLTTGNIKRLVGNRGYRRFLKIGKSTIEIDLDRVKADELYDGKYVLRTTTSLPADEVAQAYKNLTLIERLWRELKSTVEVRPIYHHQKKDNVKGHIFSCFLALYLATYLKQKLATANLKLPWDDIIRDISSIRAVVVRLNGQRYLMRTPLKGYAGTLLGTVGVKTPPLAEQL